MHSLRYPFCKILFRCFSPLEQNSFVLCNYFIIFSFISFYLFRIWKKGFIGFFWQTVLNCIESLLSKTCATTVLPSLTIDKELNGDKRALTCTPCLLFFHFITSERLLSRIWMWLHAVEWVHFGCAHCRKLQSRGLSHMNMIFAAIHMDSHRFQKSKFLRYRSKI